MLVFIPTGKYRVRSLSVRISAVQFNGVRIPSINQQYCLDSTKITNGSYQDQPGCQEKFSKISEDKD